MSAPNNSTIAIGKSASPLVSVLIRTKNRRDLLRQAVDSVLNQSWPAIEIVIVNDGGERYAPDFSQVAQPDFRTLRWLENTAGRGRSAAANTAMLAATGDYCLFLDDDDWLDPPHIANLMQALQARPGNLLAYSATRTVSQEGVIDDKAFNHPFDGIRLLAENYIPIHAALFSRMLVERNCRFDHAHDRFEDWDFWLQVMQHSDFVFVPGCTANYRIGGGSGSGLREDDDVQQHRLTIYRRWLPRCTATQLLALMDRSRAFPHIAVLRQSILEWKQRESALRAELLDVEHSLTATEGHLRDRDKLIARLRADVEVITNSRSWRLTKPLRAMSRARVVLRNEGAGGLMRRLYYKLFPDPSRLPATKATHPVPNGFHALEFPVHDKPLISIVISLYNKYEYTFHCLKSILANSGDEAYEVIVVDDCSTDDTTSMLAGIKGITVLRNEHSGGFIHSCNSGAVAARGEYLLLLDNATEVQRGWLGALCNTFRHFPDAGMAGARLLNTDGTLREAGGIVWRDGSAWHYGRGGDSNKPEYSYCRQVDYCSGACLMLPRADFMALGMLDSHYAPGCYADIDLAFRVRKAGRKVYYQPLARVIHFEDIVNGTDVDGSVKDGLQNNRNIFFERWEEKLRRHRPAGRLPELEKERYVTKRVLVIDARVLMPDHDSGSLRMFNLLKVFQVLGYKVSFIADNLQYHDRYTPMLQARGVECLYLPCNGSVKEHLEHAGSQYQVVVLSRADYAEKHIDAAIKLCPRARILYDTVDLHFLREQRLAELTGDRKQLEAAELRKVQELGIARKAHKTLIVSPVELELFHNEAPDIPVALLSNIHAVEGRNTGYDERRDILFIGSFEHPPNVDAMHFFIDEIFPLLHRRKPEMKVLIVGDKAPFNLLVKAGDHVQFTGFVDDIAPLFNKVRLSIAPLRYGAGVKGKINSSMSCGVPVIATTIAAEGMSLKHERDVLIADDAAGFAAQIVRAYDDEELWYTLSDAGFENIERCFSFEVAARKLREILA